MLRSIAAATIAMSFCSLDAAAQLAPYTAHYTAEYKGRSVGDSIFALEFDGQRDMYVFSSTLQARGLLKLVSPRPVIDRSEFRLRNSTIVPHRFEHEDGSRKGADNHTIDFDWATATARVTGAEYSREVPISEGVLDRGSLQIALLQALTEGREPSRFSVIDEDSIENYDYRFEGRESLATAMGTMEVMRFRQQRDGSSRQTLIDVAPSLGYVPVRIEQIRNGESQSLFQIQSVERP